MYLRGKLKREGYGWFIRRVMREWVNPTTRTGLFLQPITRLAHYLVSKPLDFFLSGVRSEKQTAKQSLYFFYDFEVEPVTYDFAWALCIANAKRDALNLIGLKVIFVPGRIKGLRNEALDYEAIVNPPARSWRIHSILLPLVKLVASPCSVVVCATRAEACVIRKQARFIYPDNYTVTFPVPYLPKQAMHYPEKLLALKADPQALLYVSDWLKGLAPGKKVIVITLRQYAYTPSRNSDIGAWALFASSLDHADYFVVFVADTEQSLAPLPRALMPFTFFQPACWNVLLRSAIYELAYLNLGVNTGPMALCWFNPLCRYITFKAITPNGVQASLPVMIDKGFVPGESPCFANDFQKWVWDEDEFECISDEFRRMCLKIESSHDDYVNEIVTT